MFGITAFYHRCFAHHSFRVRRPVQLLGALLGAAAAQRGPLWWVAHHRQHHRATDKAGDPHSPVTSGFLASHLFWIFTPANQATAVERVPDLAAFPELRLLDRFHHVVPVASGVAAFGLGALLSRLAPGLHTSASQMLVWGFVLPTIALYHSTFAVNSVAHLFGSRRFETSDDSRNNWFVSVLTLGEGWHNNHHQFPNSARQGLFAKEVDLTWWLIATLKLVGLASEVRTVPERALLAARRALPDLLEGAAPQGWRAKAD
jgi:stearoyl-CoA desaturase (delta-9 desaturase)